MTHPLTGSQLGVVHAQLIDADPARFTVGELITLTGPVAVNILARAIRQAVDESFFDLRVDRDGAARRTGEPEAEPHLVDLSGTDDPAGFAVEWADRRLRKGLPFGDGPLHEQTLLILGPGRVAWVSIAHHVLVDGYGLVLVVRRALQIYSAIVAGAEPEPSNLVAPEEVVRLESAYRQSSAFERDRAHWLALEESAAVAEPARLLLAGAGGVGSSGSADSTPPAPDVVRRRGVLQVGPAALDAAAQRYGCPWTDLFSAAFAVAFSRLASSADVVVGTPLMNRMGLPARCPTSVVNVLPLHVHVDPAEPISTLLQRVCASSSAQRRHSRYRQEDLARVTGRLSDQQPLIGVELNLKMFDQPSGAAGGVQVEISTLSEGPVDDLCLSVVRESDRFSWTATAPAWLGDASGTAVAALEGAVTLFEALLGEIAGSAPDRAVGSLLATPGRDEQFCMITGEGGAASVPVPVPVLWQRVVAEHGERVALVDGATRYTYAQLACRVAAVADQLALCTRPGDLVAVEVPRGADAVVALISALITGRAAVPLDPRWPLARRVALREALPAAVVLDRSLVAGWAESGDPQFVPDPFPAGTIGYLIHTSGSTGRPKAVAVPQSALAAYLEHHRNTTFAGFGDEPLRIAQSLPLEFDGSWGTLQGLFLGHELHVLGAEVVPDPAAVVETVRRERLAVLDTTPTVMAALLEEGLLTPDADGRPHPLRMLTVGGEGCPAALWRQLTAQPGLIVGNLYGPTETTVDATAAFVTGPAEEPLTIGAPHGAVRAYVLDEHLTPVPAGHSGELYLAGDQLALGYLGQSALTASTFVADPFGPPGSRMYRTGDRVHRRPDGSLAHLGRIDRQLKIRGYRVEPAEIEAVLTTLPGIRRVAVAAHDGRLLAAIVPDLLPDAASGRAALSSALLTAARGALPAHLVPSAVAVVAELPRTGTGKLDLEALQNAQQESATDGDNEPARTEAERIVVAVLSEVLSMPDRWLGRHSDFFAIGGDSITAIRVVSALRSRGMRITVSEVFTRRTVAGIAATVRETDPAEDVAMAVPATAAVNLDGAQLAQVQDLLARRGRRRSRT